MQVAPEQEGDKCLQFVLISGMYHFTGKPGRGTSSRYKCGGLRTKTGLKQSTSSEEN